MPCQDCSFLYGSDTAVLIHSHRGPHDVRICCINVMIRNISESSPHCRLSRGCIFPASHRAPRSYNIIPTKINASLSWLSPIPIQWRSPPDTCLAKHRSFATSTGLFRSSSGLIVPLIRRTFVTRQLGLYVETYPVNQVMLKPFFTNAIPAILSALRSTSNGFNTAVSSALVQFLVS